MKTRWLLVLLTACGGAAAPPPAPVAPVAPAAPPPSPAWQLPAKTALPQPPTAFPEVSLEKWRAAPKPAASPACAAYAARKPVDAPSLAEALKETSEDARDAKLAGREGAEPELSRVVRADVAPTECGDAIVDPVLAKKTSAKTELEHALLGLSLAGRLARTAHRPPTLDPNADKTKMKAFIQGPLKKWMVDEAGAIERLSLAGRELVGYGRGVVAIEAGTADLRLVDEIRSSPTPKAWDSELRQVYEQALDEALEPRKSRGRDAALVGLADFAAMGALADVRVERARAILGKSYGGRRIDALDHLLYPYERIVPARSTWMLAKAGRDESPRAQLEAGRIYWQRAFFASAAHAYAGGKQPEDRLGLAIALALVKGPASPAELMREPLALVHTEALDELAAEGGPLAGHAAYDAAYLRAISPPEGSPKAHFEDVAARFRKAEALLSDPALKKKAAERAADAAAH